MGVQDDNLSVINLKGNYALQDSGYLLSKIKYKNLKRTVILMPDYAPQCEEHPSCCAVMMCTVW
jgi:hypothetical protein